MHVRGEQAQNGAGFACVTVHPFAAGSTETQSSLEKWAQYRQRCPELHGTALSLASGSACGHGAQPRQAAGLHLEYLYASPLDVAPLDIRAEIEALATMPGVECLSATCPSKQSSSRMGRSLCMYICR